MTDLRSLLERADRAVFRVPLPGDGIERLEHRRDRKGRNQRIGAGVVGIAVFVAAVWATTGGLLDRAQTPAAPGGAETGPPIPGPHERLGFVSLPPNGGGPSIPETGELVLSYGGRPGDWPAASSTGLAVWVYADGRVISWRERRPHGADGVRTGFLEQRLTPEGVELMRSEIVSTGMFGEDLAFRSAPGLATGEIQVRNGDRLVSIRWCWLRTRPCPLRDTIGMTTGQADVLSQLGARLADPASWLPARAWEEQNAYAYVPSAYAICYWDEQGGLEPSRVLISLPAEAEDLLLGRDMAYEAFTLASDVVSPYAICSEVTTGDARALNEILSGAGFDRDRSIEWTLQYRFEAPDPIGEAVWISFQPILPHGLWEAVGGCC